MEHLSRTLIDVTAKQRPSSPSLGTSRNDDNIDSVRRAGQRYSQSPTGHLLLCEKTAIEKSRTNLASSMIVTVISINMADLGGAATRTADIV